jgi:hypothetical protein
MKVVRRRFSSVLGTLVLVAAGAGGTSCKSHGSPGSAPAGSASAAVEKVPPNADPELYHELSKIAKVCKVDDKQAMVTCPEGDHRKLAGLYISNQGPESKPSRRSSSRSTRRIRSSQRSLQTFCIRRSARRGARIWRRARSRRRTRKRC